MISALASATSERMDKMSSNFGSMANEYRLPVRSNWKETFFGSDPGPNTDWGDMQDELREEDVWSEESRAAERIQGVLLNRGMMKKSVALESSRGFSGPPRSWLSMEMNTVIDGGRSGAAAAGYSVASAMQNGRFLKSGCEMDNISANGNSPEKQKTKNASSGRWRRWANCGREEQEEDEQEEDDGIGAVVRLPPHELLAREYANSQAMAFSVFEGAGRTLKGMDLRRVRNAVWMQTGFID